MAVILTDDSVTQEEAKIVARNAGAQKPAASTRPEAVPSTTQAGSDMLDPSNDSGASMASGAVEQATAMARNVGEQISAAGYALYQEGARTGGSMTRTVGRYPLTAMLVAGLIGGMAAYLACMPRDRAN